MYVVCKSELDQYNQITILLETNWKAFSGKCNHHISIRYFFIKDRVGVGGVEIYHCPVDEMVGGFFTNPSKLKR